MRDVTVDELVQLAVEEFRIADTKALRKIIQEIVNCLGHPAHCESADEIVEIMQDNIWVMEEYDVEISNLCRGLPLLMNGDSDSSFRKERMAFFTFEICTYLILYVVAD